MKICKDEPKELDTGLRYSDLISGDIFTWKDNGQVYICISELRWLRLETGRVFSRNIPSVGPVVRYPDACVVLGRKE